jgi:hypothetical protein
MGTLLAAVMMIAQDPGALRAENMVRDLSDELIEVRARAHAEILKLGAVAYPALRRALDGSDAEARARAAAILRSPAFVGVPEVVEDNLKLLRTENREHWVKAVEDLLTAGPAAVPAIRKAAESMENRSAFRARQLAAILESAPVRGLRFGILVEEPEAELEGAVAGWDVLINTTREPVRFEANRMSRVFARPLETDSDGVRMKHTRA